MVKLMNPDTDESIDIADIKPNVKFLPVTVGGLAGIHATRKT